MTSYYQFFKENPILNVKVNDVEYQPVLGTNTGSGYYSNGWRVRELNGDKNYIEIHFYTSAHHKIDIEERWLIREDDKICKRTGWHDINLLRMETVDNHRNDLETYKKKFVFPIND